MELFPEFLLELLEVFSEFLQKYFRILVWQFYQEFPCEVFPGLLKIVSLKILQVKILKDFFEKFLVELQKIISAIT